MSLKNKIIISLIGFLLILIINTKVDAASASLSASSTSVYVGTKVTITTTIQVMQKTPKKLKRQLLHLQRQGYIK